MVLVDGLVRDRHDSEEYDVKIKGDDVRNSQTVNDLYEIVKSRL